MKCPNCGKEIAEDSKFCNYCGAKTEKKEESSVIVTVLLAALAALLLIVCIGVWISKTHSTVPDLSPMPFVSEIEEAITDTVIDDEVVSEEPVEQEPVPEPEQTLSNYIHLDASKCKVLHSCKVGEETVLFVDYKQKTRQGTMHRLMACELDGEQQAKFADNRINDTVTLKILDMEGYSIYKSYSPITEFYYYVPSKNSRRFYLAIYDCEGSAAWPTSHKLFKIEVDSKKVYWTTPLVQCVGIAVNGTKGFRFIEARFVREGEYHALDEWEMHEELMDWNGKVTSVLPQVYDDMDDLRIRYARNPDAYMLFKGFSVSR